MDPFNGSMTIWRADSLPTETAETQQQAPAISDLQPDSNAPVRQSLKMKKPSVDFNAIGPDFMNKMSQAAAQANAEDLENQKASGKKPKKLFWNLASSLRNIVTKPFKRSSSQPQSTPQKNEQKKPDFAKQFEEVIEQNQVLGGNNEGRNQRAIEQTPPPQFSSFDDQLKQLKFTQEKSVNSALQLMQPVLFKGEEEAARKAGLSDSLTKEQRDKAIDMFKIEDDEEGEDDAENQSKR